MVKVGPGAACGPPHLYVSPPLVKSSTRLLFNQLSTNIKICYINVQVFI